MTPAFRALSFSRTWPWLASVLALLLAASGAQAQAPTWQRAVVLTTYNYSACAVKSAVTDANGNVYLAGNFTGALNLSGLTLSSIGHYDGFVAKWSSATNRFAWVQRIGGSNFDTATGIAVNGTSVYVVGYYESPLLYFGSSTTPLAKAGNGYDSFVVKLTDAGTSASFTWSERVSGNADDVAYGVAVQGERVYVTGYFGDAGLDATFGGLTLKAAGGSDVFIAKLTDAGSTGSFKWVERAGGTGPDVARALAVSGNSLFVVGSSTSEAPVFGTTKLAGANGYEHLFVTKLIDAGTTASFAWAQRTGNATSNERATTVAVSGTSLYVGGKILSPLAPFGTTLLTSKGGTDAFVTKFSDTGSSASQGWTQQIGSDHEEEATGLATRGTSVYVVGVCGSQKTAFGPTVVADGPTGFVAKLADAGPTSAFTWVQRTGGGGYYGVEAVALNNTGGVYVAGRFTTPTADFGTTTLTNPSGSLSLDIAYLALLQDAEALASRPATGPLAAVRVFPNPTRARTTVQLPAGVGSSTAALTLSDALGRVLRTYLLPLPTQGLSYDLNLAGLPGGVYSLRVQAGPASTTRRLTVE